jgi:hypothetical protein
MTTPTPGQVEERIREIEVALQQIRTDYRALHGWVYQSSGSSEVKVRVSRADPTSSNALTRGAAKGTLRWSYRRLNEPVLRILEKVARELDAEFGPEVAPGRMSGDTRLHPKTMAALTEAQHRRRGRNED